MFLYRDVAQFGRALRSGRRGRRFESCHLDQQKIPAKWLWNQPLAGFCFTLIRLFTL